MGYTFRDNVLDSTRNVFVFGTPVLISVKKISDNLSQAVLSYGMGGMDIHISFHSTICSRQMQVLFSEA